ncbi:hypothetical protein H5410_035451 [Solanum commersonii]|uniref:Uncharacterized protein n=1 Tax=Solanum commersonii TaxID=4109 RepID=A0A9J5Y0Q0_SOLCO|nr:hypothetical protein H5410_035451 [Solanum commersonii]
MTFSLFKVEDNRSTKFGKLALCWAYRYETHNQAKYCTDIVQKYHQLNMSEGFTSSVKRSQLRADEVLNCCCTKKFLLQTPEQFFLSRISAMIELSLPFTLGPRPPMEINSPYAAGASVPANAIGTPPFNKIITYWGKTSRVTSTYFHKSKFTLS